MDEQLQQRIALKLVERQLMKGLPAPNDFMREMGNVARDIGETPDTLRSFYEAILPKIIGRMLNRKSVSLETAD